VVVGSRGLGGFTGLQVGSVGVQVATHATCPVVVVRRTQPNSGDVLVGVDRTGPAEAILDYAFQQAAWCGKRLVAVHAWRWPAQAEPGGVMSPVFDPDSEQVRQNGSSPKPSPAGRRSTRTCPSSNVSSAAAPAGSSPTLRTMPPSPSWAPAGTAPRSACYSGQRASWSCITPDPRSLSYIRTDRRSGRVTRELSSSSRRSRPVAPVAAHPRPVPQGIDAAEQADRRRNEPGVFRQRAVQLRRAAPPRLFIRASRTQSEYRDRHRHQSDAAPLEEPVCVAVPAARTNRGAEDDQVVVSGQLAYRLRRTHVHPGTARDGDGRDRLRDLPGRTVPGGVRHENTSHNCHLHRDCPPWTLRSAGTKVPPTRHGVCRSGLSGPAVPRRNKRNCPATDAQGRWSLPTRVLTGSRFGWSRRRR
jgi:hypothetical protein